MALRKENFEDEQNKAKKRYRLTIDVSSEVHRQVKIEAAKNEVSVSDYVMDALKKVLPEPVETSQQPHPVSKEAIERLMQFREALKRETNGQIFDDSAEILRQERAKRTEHLMSLHTFEAHE